MYTTTYARINAISATATTCLLTVLGLVALTSFLIPSNLQPTSLKVNSLNVVLGRLDWDRREKEFAFARFDIQADLQPLFNWNTKQLFVYFVAEYKTGSYPENQVVIWDRIVRRKKDARINLSGGKNKYHFKEITENFRNISATFSLQYNLMPHVGFLRYGEAGRTETLQFPAVTRKVTG